MDNPLFLRVRGRVLGPYEQNKLQSLVKRGQLSRMHELSTDGVSWVRASTFPELFASSQTGLPSFAESSQGPAMASEPVDQPNASTGSAASATGNAAPSPPHWFYSSSGTERGPVDFTQLQMLVGTGQLTPQDLVWTEGMAAWAPANSVAGLFRATGPTAAGGHLQEYPTGFDFQAGSNHLMRGGGSMDTLPDGLTRTVTNSRGWVLFISIMLFVLSASEAGSGIYLLVRGARSAIGSNGLVASGVIALLFALTIAVGGLFLLRYASRLGAVRFEPRAIVLEKAMEALGACWVFLGIFLIVILIFVTVVVVVAIAEGALIL